MRSWIVLLAVLSLVPSSALMQEKGGEDEFGPYEVVENWPQPIPGTEGYTWGSTGGVFAETPDRIWIGQRGMLALPAGAKFGVPLQGQATGRDEPEMDALHFRRRSQRPAWCSRGRSTTRSSSRKARAARTRSR